jgi:molybdopterin/thiamine biosynthesis adenylyltransferase
MTVKQTMRTLYRSMFKEIGEAGNEKLLGKKVTVAGLGGVGSIVTAILAREDFELRIIDKGRVEEADMNRMGLYLEQDITKFKAKQAKTRVEAVNPKLTMKAFHEELAENNVFLVKSDCVIDCTNNLESNTMIFNYCQEAKVPLIMASYHGSVCEILVATKKLPKKVFEEYLKRSSTEEEGAISPATHTAASMAVVMLFKILLGKGKSQRFSFDVWTGKLKEKTL